MDAVVLTLARLARLLERACTELTLSQYRLLAMIADGAERASQIAGRLAVTKPTVSATIDTLVERGLVSRAMADDDRRALRLQITAEGRAVLGAAERGMREQLDALLIHVDDPQAVRLALGRLGDALDQRREQRRVAREQA
ncbi:MAG TPA: MarR family transcriptional regulator [Acidimicrobiia bacterium]|jgi:DNA-binding MarR family transcriptional regulator|nr:MarR family transcriptional regulator [Acidimicrobiia bacterium]